MTVTVTATPEAKLGDLEQSATASEWLWKRACANVDRVIAKPDATPEEEIVAGLGLLGATILKIRAAWRRSPSQGGHDGT